MNFVNDNYDTAENIACKLQKANQKSNTKSTTVCKNGGAEFIASPNVEFCISTCHQWVNSRTYWYVVVVRMPGI